MFIAGFSQGCCMALYAAVMCPQTLGGVVGLSGDVMACLNQQIQDDKDGSFEVKKKELPFFIYHGRNDDVV